MKKSVFFEKEISKNDVISRRYFKLGCP